MTNSHSNTIRLRESFDALHIQQVAVVDDAFDQVTSDTFQEGELNEFIGVVNEQDQLIRECRKLMTEIDCEEILVSEDLSDENFALLWEKRAQATQELKVVLNRTLFRVHEQKFMQVEHLCTYLEEQLNMRVEKFGTQDKLPTDNFDLAFIDYRFGPPGQDESVARAVRWAKNFFENNHTFIILMSAEIGAPENQDDFREKSNITRGLFEYLAKEEIEHYDKFCNRLNSFCAGYNTRLKIHGFAKAAENAADEALSFLLKSIRALGLEDYAYLEQISLNGDGHPLGDYILWLFGEYFAHNLAVNESLRETRKSLNGIKYDRFLPLQRPPSLMLAEMYSAAITEPVHEGWEPHPRAVQVNAEEAETRTEAAGNSVAASGARPAPPAGEAYQADVFAPDAHSGDNPQMEADSIDSVCAAYSSEPTSPANMPRYQLGDLILANKDQPAYLVINAACDLQFSPGKRDCDIDQPILLIPGRLEPLNERGTEANAKRTELFELNGEKFRIIWQHTRVIAVPRKDLSSYKSFGYERNWRLKLPYALEIQQHFAAQLTRVGVPTPVPVFCESPVAIYGKDADGNYLKLGTVPSGLVLFHHRNQNQFVLTVDCVHKVLNLIDRFITKVRSEVEEDQSTAGKLPAEIPMDNATAKEVEPAAKKKQKKRDPAAEARERTNRRIKYLEDLKKSRRVLAERCVFQESLHDVPEAGQKAKLKVYGIPEYDLQHQIQIMHSESLAGQYDGNAPVVLTFSLSEPTASTDVNTPEIEKEILIKAHEAAANGTGEEPPR